MDICRFYRGFFCSPQRIKRCRACVRWANNQVGVLGSAEKIFRELQKIP